MVQRAPMTAWPALSLEHSPCVHGRVGMHFGLLVPLWDPHGLRVCVRRCLPSPWEEEFLARLAVQRRWVCPLCLDFSAPTEMLSREVRLPSPAPRRPSPCSPGRARAGRRPKAVPTLKRSSRDCTGLWAPQAVGRGPVYLGLVDSVTWNKIQRSAGVPDDIRHVPPSVSGGGDPGSVRPQ